MTSKFSRENNYLRRSVDWTSDYFQDGIDWNVTVSFFSGGQMVANFGVPNEKFALKAGSDKISIEYVAKESFPWYVLRKVSSKESSQILMIKVGSF